MGRYKKPTLLKQLEGTDRADRRNDNEPQYDSDLPDPPAHLTEGAVAEWHRQLAEVDNDGINCLTGIDLAIYATYCEQYDRWQQAATELKSQDLVINTGAGNQIHNPLIGVSNTAQTNMNKAGALCGFNPCDRTKVTAKKKPKKNAFSKFG